MADICEEIDVQTEQLVDEPNTVFLEASTTSVVEEIHIATNITNEETVASSQEEIGTFYISEIQPVSEIAMDSSQYITPDENVVMEIPDDVAFVEEGTAIIRLEQGVFGHPLFEALADVTALLEDATCPRAILIGDAGAKVVFPLLPLVAASPLVAEMAIGAEEADEIVVHLPGFDLKTIQMLLQIVTSGQATLEGEHKLEELCQTLNVPAELTPQVFTLTQYTVDSIVMVVATPVDAKEAIEAVREKTKLKDKEKEVESNEIHKCEECGKSYKHRSTLVSHMRTHGLVDKPYQCTVCNKRFQLPRSLAAHKKRHTEPRQKKKQIHKCDVCDKELRCNSAVIEHMRTHTQERPYECNVCNKRFRTKQILKFHAARHLGIKDVECDVCGKTFVNKSDLKAHARVHKDAGRFSCEVCGKLFALKYHLTSHMNVHTRSTLHECSYCGKTFLQAGSLRRHVRCHTGEKPYECSACGERFPSREHVNTHQRQVHAVPKPYQCEHCGKQFSYGYSLDAHVRMHTGENVFECESCHKKFAKKDVYDAHMNMHKGVKPYKCELCGNQFTKNSYMLTHMRRVHKVQATTRVQIT